MKILIPIEESTDDTRLSDNWWVKFISGNVARCKGPRATIEQTLKGRTNITHYSCGKPTEEATK
jgi:hypothetical protein